MLEPTSGECVLYISVSSYKELVANAKIYELLGSGNHNHIHFEIKIKPESKNKKNTGETSTKKNKVNITKRETLF